MKRQQIRRIVCTALVLAAMTAVIPAESAGAATASSTSSSSASSSKKAKAAGEAASSETIKFGKVTAVGKSKITVELGEMKVPSKDAGDKKFGGKMPEKPADGASAPKRPSGKRPEMPDGFKKDFPGKPADAEGKDEKFDISSMITWSGEKKTIDISKVTLTKDGKTAKISDISKDDVLTLIYKEGTLTEIKIGADMGIPSFGEGRPGKGAKPAKSRTSSGKGGKSTSSTKK